MIYQHISSPLFPHAGSVATPRANKGDVKFRRDFEATSEDTAVAIVKGVSSRGREIYYPRMEVGFGMAASYCPPLMDYLYASRVEKNTE